MNKLPALSLTPSPSSHTIGFLPPLLKSDYPNIRFWDWKSYSPPKKDATDANTTAGKRGGARAAAGENVRLLWIENEDGSIIDGHVASAIRAKCRSLWIQMLVDGTAYKSWLKIPDVAATNFRNAICDAFPQLRLCENDWKAQALAKEEYPHFDRVSLAAELGVLVPGEPIDNPTQSRTKRKHRSHRDSDHKSKKIKVLDAEDNIDEDGPSNTNDPPLSTSDSPAPENSRGVSVGPLKAKVTICICPPK